jgi:alpha-galactosidase
VISRLLSMELNPETQQAQSSWATHLHMRAQILSAIIASCIFSTSAAFSAEIVWLDQLDLRVASQGFGTPQKNRSVDGNLLSIGGKKFERGFGTHAESSLVIRLDSKAQSFSAQVGVDDEVMSSRASLEFFVYGDGKELWASKIMRAGDLPKVCSVSLKGIKSLELVVADGGDGFNSDHADWADAKIESIGSKTFTTSSSVSVEPYILTPPAPPTPRINGASIFGVRPGSLFLFTVPATGDRPMIFSAADLPEGLKLDSQTGRITGKIDAKGTYVVTLGAENSKGQSTKKLRIVCGDRIALTPPMGWNSWNCFAAAVSADKVKRAADAMVSSGLINHGWTYINVDDFWQNHRDSTDPTIRGEFRDAKGNIIPNFRFGDMKALADYIHGLGLKAGLYSSPGPWTCGGCVGSFGHEEQDAKAYAEWGFDYLKHDWCSYGGVVTNSKRDTRDVRSLEFAHNDQRDTAMAPYLVMGAYLRQQPRDIVFSLCQYGGANVWEWGDTVDGNSWRTTGDIGNSWQSMKNIALSQDKSAAWAKPGNWNDPDMLIVGRIGWGNPKPTRLTPDEQYLHVSLWSLFAAPLLIGCDLENLDAFTLNLLTNDEVIAVNQDPLGKQATCIDSDGDFRVYVKELEDGDRVVCFCNFGRQVLRIDYKNLAKLGITGRQLVRDLWRQKDLGVIDTRSHSLPLEIPVHGVVLHKFSAAR